jgi:hypothetical protein
MKVKFSCVMDQPPKFARQALVWAASLLTFGEQEAESLVIHAVEMDDPVYKRIFDSWGIETRIVKRFDVTYPHSNKLNQLESEPLHTADYVVLCDCDIVFCANILPWITGNSIQARTPSYAGLAPTQWGRLFHRANLNLPESRVRALLNDRETLPTYCSGALYIIPQGIFQSLRSVWPKWARWLFERSELVRPLGTYIDQISLTMSCAELGLKVDLLPVELNFPVRIFPSGHLYHAGTKTSYRPLVMHHHRRNQRGLLMLTTIPSLNRQIRPINRLIRSIRSTEFQRPDESRRDAIAPEARHRIMSRFKCYD